MTEVEDVRKCLFFYTFFCESMEIIYMVKEMCKMKFVIQTFYFLVIKINKLINKLELLLFWMV